MTARGYAAPDCSHGVKRVLDTSPFESPGNRVLARLAIPPAIRTLGEQQDAPQAPQLATTASPFTPAEEISSVGMIVDCAIEHPLSEEGA